MIEEEIAIQERVKEGCTLIDLTAEMLEYPKTMVLKNHVMKLLDQDHKRLVLNLSNVKMLDSFAIAAFISIMKLCKTKGGSLTLYGLNDSVNHIFELTRMDRVLEIWDTEGQALYQAKIAVS